MAGVLGDAKYVLFAVVHRPSGRAVGWTTYMDVVVQDERLEIGWTWYGRAHWRSPVNTGTKLPLLTHAFGELGRGRVRPRTDHRDERSQAAIARLGARCEGVLRRHRRRPGGGWRDSVCFSLPADEWPAAKARLTARPAAGRERPAAGCEGRGCRSGGAGPVPGGPLPRGVLGAVGVLAGTRAPDRDEDPEGLVAVDLGGDGLLAGRAHESGPLSGVTLFVRHLFTVGGAGDFGKSFPLRCRCVAPRFTVRGVAFRDPTCPYRFRRCRTRPWSPGPSPDGACSGSPKRPE